MAYWDGGGAVIDRAGDDDWNAPAAIPSLVPTFPRDQRRFAGTLPAESSALPRNRLRPPSAAAERRCPSPNCAPPRLGVGADRVLITWGLISEETYVAALAASLGMVFEPLFNTPREHCPLPDDKLIEAANTGMLPLSTATASRSWWRRAWSTAAAWSRSRCPAPSIARRIRITSAARLHDFVARHSAREIARRAVDELRSRHPEFSAGVGRPRRLVVVGLARAGRARGVSPCPARR